MKDSVQQIKNIIQKQGINLPDETWTHFEQIWQPVSFKRKTIITQKGQVERYLYFVTEGVQRVYYDDEQDREATLIFSYPYSFTGVLDSFMLQTPSRYTFETLTNSVLLKTSYQQFQEITEQYPEINLFVNKAMNHVTSGLLERITELQCFSSEEKFRQLLLRSPHILQHVPHKYLANYLGIDPTNFSKLINNVKI